MTVLTLPVDHKYFHVQERSTDYLEKNNNKVKPFVKWAGGKSKLVGTILKFISNHICLDEIEHYIEPFVGGGAMFFYLASHNKFKSMTIIDLNLDLINAYKSIKENPFLLMKHMNVLQEKYNVFSSFKDKERYYYEIREHFNFESNTLTDEETNVYRASQFIFLNKSGFNGLYRVNKSGDFNVPFGKKEKINIYDASNILRIHKLLQNTKIVHGDFSETLNYIHDKTFVYFDPPYRPITTTSSFTSYTNNGFDDNEQISLAQLCMQLYILGVHFALSNSDPHNIDPTDMFFDNLYNGFHIYRINASRQIAAEASSRKQLSEILIVG